MPKMLSIFQCYFIRLVCFFCWYIFATICWRCLNDFNKSNSIQITIDPDSSLFDGPSVSGITTAACTLGAVSAEKCNTSTTTISPTIQITEAGEGNHNLNGNAYDVSSIPSSSASTTPLISVPNSPDTGATPKIIVTTTNTTESNRSKDLSMPAKTTFTSVTTTTTAEIMDGNRFSILGKDISNEIDVYSLPSPPKNGFNTPAPEVTTNALLNASAGTTASTASTPSSSNTPNQHNDRDSLSGSPTKKKHHHKNENNNHQKDINSIESISDNTKLPSSDLEWIDELLLERNSREMLSKKKKKKISSTKELDQLDGVSNKHNAKDEMNDENEKVVKCLYYTLMCCECTIS
ncbi:uncharacterized protein DDB_G0280579 isoform X2 [Eurosta solidaginis]|uniref:uncharacterized protein DDB_G0280579 isoform X2 n=1 Tax=Eurosta solidaginis TaxID=178769 RepID=UPI003531357F